MKPTLTAALDTGLAWLFDTEQPADAHVFHLGESLWTNVNRHVSFVPSGVDHLPVVVLNVSRGEYTTSHDGHVLPSNPLLKGELEDLAADLERRGYPIHKTWNGHPGITGSVCLARPAHPTLLAAVARYHAGCPAHPSESVFCGCEVWRGQYARRVQLTAPAASGAVTA